MILEILKDPNPILRQVSETVKKIDNEILEFAEDLTETMIHSGGIGLAAVQVGRPIRMVAILNNRMDELIDSREIPVLIMVNPKIIKQSDEMVKMTEGCLSFGDLRKRISRPTQIDVKYYNLEGKEVIVKLRGVNARVVEHEIDHTLGKLMTDYEG